jgi:hypothetical protein
VQVFQREESLKSPSGHPPVGRGSNASTYTAGRVYSMAEEIIALNIQRDKALSDLDFHIKLRGPRGSGISLPKASGQSPE